MSIKISSKKSPMEFLSLGPPVLPVLSFEKSNITNDDDFSNIEIHNEKILFLDIVRNTLNLLTALSDTSRFRNFVNWLFVQPELKVHEFLKKLGGKIKKCESVIIKQRQTEYCQILTCQINMQLSDIRADLIYLFHNDDYSAFVANLDFSTRVDIEKHVHHIEYMFPKLMITTDIMNVNKLFNINPLSDLIMFTELHDELYIKWGGNKIMFKKMLPHIHALVCTILCHISIGANKEKIAKMKMNHEMIHTKLEEIKKIKEYIKTLDMLVNKTNSNFIQRMNGKLLYIEIDDQERGRFKYIIEDIKKILNEIFSMFVHIYDVEYPGLIEPLVQLPHHYTYIPKTPSAPPLTPPEASAPQLTPTP